MGFKKELKRSVASMMILSDYPGRMFMTEKNHEQFAKEMQLYIGTLLKFAISHGYASSDMIIDAWLENTMSEMGKLTVGQLAVAPFYYTFRLLLAGDSVLGDEDFYWFAVIHSETSARLEKYGIWNDGKEFMDQVCDAFPDAYSMLQEEYGKLTERAQRYAKEHGL